MTEYYRGMNVKLMSSYHWYRLNALDLAMWKEHDKHSKPTQEVIAERIARRDYQSRMALESK